MRHISRRRATHQPKAQWDTSAELVHWVGAPCRIRTCGLVLRRHPLWSTELRGRGTADYKDGSAEGRRLSYSRVACASAREASQPRPSSTTTEDRIKAPPRYWIGLAASPRMMTASNTLLAGSKVLRMAARDAPISRRPRMNARIGMVLAITAKAMRSAAREGVQFTISWPVAAANPLHTIAAAVAIVAVAETGGIRGSSRLPRRM